MKNSTRPRKDYSQRQSDSYLPPNEPKWHCSYCYLLVLGPAKNVLMYKTGGIFTCNWIKGTWFSGLGTIGRGSTGRPAQKPLRTQRNKHEGALMNLIFRGHLLIPVPNSPAFGYQYIASIRRMLHS